ncbi:MAG: putative nucleic acid-binding protein [Rhodothermales bacterium]
MIIVDTSVWIDYFNGRETPQSRALDSLLGRDPIAIGDLILAEILQGFRSDRDYLRAKRALLALPVLEMLGVERSIKCAENFRALRKKGVTIRKTTDVIIASYCIDNSHALLYADRDFDPFVKHLGLATL